MLVGRTAEQRRMAELLAGARLGSSGVLLVRGEAGIGKTALLDDTGGRAGDMTVLRFSGTDAESTLGFSGLHQLLLPALKLIDELPAPQADALAVALMLRNGPAPERFAIGAATLSLLSRFARDRPLLAIVDDAHLLDPPSAEALRFVARRLVADPIALVFGVRSDEGSPFHDAGLPVLELRGLDLSSARELIAATSGVPVAADVSLRLHDVTEGNPLALVELSRDTDRIERTSPDFPLPVPETVARAFGRRIVELPDAARTALLVAAVADGDLPTAVRAADALGAGVEHLAAAEAAGLVRIDGARVEFRHPLVRSAVYAAADAHARRDAHGAVAEALPDAMADRRAWHRSEACIGPDDAVAAGLAVLAERAAAKGAYGVATTALTRSAELTVSHSLRAVRLNAAGESAWFAGHADRAVELLSRAAELESDTVTLADIEGLLGNIALRAGSLREAHRQLTTAAGRTLETDPDRALELLADAMAACFYLCDTAGGLAAAARMETIIDRCDTTARVRAMMAIGIARVLAGEDGVDWIRSAVAAITASPDMLDDPRRPDWTVIGTLFLRESTVGRELVNHVVRDRRARTALGALPNLLFHLARDDATTDRWRSALSNYDESIALARESGQTTDLATSLAGLAWLQARMGDAEGCRRHAQEACALADAHDITLARLWAEFALGDLALASGEAAAARDRYVGARNLLNSTGFRDVDIAPGPELVEAYVRVGDIDAARATAAEYLSAATAKGQPWALARAHRAAALVADDRHGAVGHFEEALRLHELSPDRFEVARTRLAYGAALRRDRQRVAARPHLRAALQGFEYLGALPWVDLAAAELDATGERARRAADDYSTALTSQELRIAQMLGGGATTKEAAAALFLSPKTVEYHLRHVYQKLGIRSRDELRSVLDG